MIEEQEQIKPFIPIWNKGKNQLIAYEIRPFDDGYGHIADITYAIFIDKNKEQQEVVAWINWK
jgi:hypothetical protein